MHACTNTAHVGLGAMWLPHQQRKPYNSQVLARHLAFFANVVKGGGCYGHAGIVLVVTGMSASKGFVSVGYGNVTVTDAEVIRATCNTVIGRTASVIGESFRANNVKVDGCRSEMGMATQGL